MCQIAVSSGKYVFVQFIQNERIFQNFSKIRIHFIHETFKNIFNYSDMIN